MRSVNANLFDINQAKSRIKAAEKAGQTPSSEDVALEATERQNAFAIAQGTGTVWPFSSASASEKGENGQKDW